MKKTLLSLGIATSLLAALVPVAALAQYGGGGGIVGGMFGFGFVNTKSPTAPTTTPVAPIWTIQTGGEVLGASTYNFAKKMQYHDFGISVTELQKILIAQGYLKLDAPTGKFGPATYLAVKAFQKANGITPASGFVGPLTLAALNG